MPSSKAKALADGAKKAEGAMTAPDRLMLLITVVNRPKADFYIDLLSAFEINMQLILSAQGTANKEALNLLGLEDSDRTVILSVIRRDMAEKALDALETRFRTVKNGKGIAYTVPLSSTVGVAIYRFLSNNTGGTK